MWTNKARRNLPIFTPWGIAASGFGARSSASGRLELLQLLLRYIREKQHRRQPLSLPEHASSDGSSPRGRLALDSAEAACNQMATANAYGGCEVLHGYPSVT